ncbi:amidohydrolase family protein [Marinibacterium sp. SX1]|uniref:amidohydrolase family protein n=1 Tax=Marinibacterium sp. SX1 TaxID=3388424 RepID=UPI003D169949
MDPVTPPPSQGAQYLVRAGLMITDPGSNAPVLVDHGLRVEGTTIAEIAPFARLARDWPGLDVLGDGETILLPGLINAHDHGRGVSPQSLGIDDDLLEPWILNLSRMPALDAETDTALSGLRQMQTGITTTINSYYHPQNDSAAIAAVRRGYARAGLRAGLVLSAMDRPASADLMARAAARLSPELAAELAAERAGRPAFDMDAWAAALRGAAAERIGLSWMMAGVISAHWSSDAQIQSVEALAHELGLAAQMHLLESRYQARDNARAAGGSVVRHLDGLGVLRPGLSCAHGVQLTGDDMAVLARNGVAVVHNPSSNLRLQSGIAPVPAMLAAGVNVALGLDSMGLDDRTDMFQEMRLAHRLHGRLSGRQVLAMATTSAAGAIGRDDIGRLARGMQADLLLVDGNARPAPGLAAAERACDRLVLYGEPAALRELVIAGRRVMPGGRHPTQDADALLARLDPPAARGDARLARLMAPLHAILGEEQAGG